MTTTQTVELGRLTKTWTPAKGDIAELKKWRADDAALDKLHVEADPQVIRAAMQAAGEAFSASQKPEDFAELLKLQDIGLAKIQQSASNRQRLADARLELARKTEPTVRKFAADVRQLVLKALEKQQEADTAQAESWGIAPAPSPVYLAIDGTLKQLDKALECLAADFAPWRVQEVLDFLGLGGGE